MNNYVYYKIQKEDENEFDNLLNVISNIKYRKFYVPEVILCEEKAEESLEYSPFIKEDVVDNTVKSIRNLNDLRDIMYNFITTSKDYIEMRDKTFEQIYSIWRNRCNSNTLHKPIKNKY